MKKYIRNFVLAVVLVACMPCTILASDNGNVNRVNQPRITCINGCKFLSVLICGHNWDFDGVSSHGSCTTTWYTCNYTGYLCTTCGNMQSMSSVNAGTGLHYCHQLHSSCGRGDTGDCKGGTVGA